ncbi:MAG: GYD domain-containing protein [Hyphomicrobiales bacterium]|nr:GYD domain-containing protein [Hyphomicrobiales bacterium]
MPTYVVLSHFTEQGIKSVKDTVKRSEAFKTAAKAAGVTVKEILWVQGQYDVVTILEGPDEAIAALGLSVAKLGNISSQTLRGFTTADMEKILAKVS